MPEAAVAAAYDDGVAAVAAYDDGVAAVVPYALVEAAAYLSFASALRLSECVFRCCTGYRQMPVQQKHSEKTQ